MRLEINGFLVMLAKRLQLVYNVYKTNVFFKRIKIYLDGLIPSAVDIVDSTIKNVFK